MPDVMQKMTSGVKKIEIKFYPSLPSLLTRYDVIL